MKVSREQLQLAAWYNARVDQDPSNPPTRRDVAREAGISVSAAQAWLTKLEDEGLLRYPIRRKPTRGHS